MESRQNNNYFCCQQITKQNNKNRNTLNCVTTSAIICQLIVILNVSWYKLSNDNNYIYIYIYIYIYFENIITQSLMILPEKCTLIKNKLARFVVGEKYHVTYVRK